MASIEELYKTAVSMADSISKEMSWIYANYEILKHSKNYDLEKRFLGTYAGHAYIVLRRTLLNEIHLGISRILIDNNEHVNSLPRLYELIKGTKMVEHLEQKYTQSKGTFRRRMCLLNKRLGELINNLKKSDSTMAKALIIYRNGNLAHTAAKQYAGTNNLQWGDEAKLIGILTKIIEPMEHLF